MTSEAVLDVLDRNRRSGSTQALVEAVASTDRPVTIVVASRQHANDLENRLRERGLRNRVTLLPLTGLNAGNPQVRGQGPQALLFETTAVYALIGEHRAIEKRLDLLRRESQAQETELRRQLRGAQDQNYALSLRVTALETELSVEAEVIGLAPSLKKETL